MKRELIAIPVDVHRLASLLSSTELFRGEIQDDALPGSELRMPR
jgi:hypothetical protein